MEAPSIIEHEAIRVVVEDLESLLSHLREHRLVGKSVVVDDRRRAAASVDLVLRDVHVREREETEELRGVRRNRVEGGTGRSVGEAGCLEGADQVTLRVEDARGDAPSGGDVRRKNVVGTVTASASRSCRREEPLTAAAHEDAEVGLGCRLVEELVADAGAGAAIRRMSAEGSGSGVEDVRCGDDAERFALRAGEVFADVLDARIVECVARVVREHALLVVVGLVAGRVAGGSWR